MASYKFSDWIYVYLNSDGNFVNGFKAEDFSSIWRDYGTYLVPEDFYD